MWHSWMMRSGDALDRLGWFETGIAAVSLAVGIVALALAETAAAEAILPIFMVSILVVGRSSSWIMPASWRAPAHPTELPHG
jgi:hypothetical protein